MDKNFADVRREYGELQCNEVDMNLNPIEQFKLWFADIQKTETLDPTAMILSTVDNKGRPDARTLLLKDIDLDKFVFYTNYKSAKAQQLANNAEVALTFFWPALGRQVRVRGTVSFTSKEESDEYFYSRPLAYQVSAIVSPQSHEIQSREELQRALDSLMQQEDIKHVRPEHWGGYKVTPYEIEFMQARNNRLHDRIRFLSIPSCRCYHIDCMISILVCFRSL